MENQKKRKYNQRILDDENHSFTTLIFTTNGGMSTEAKQCYKQLLCEKSDVSNSDTSVWVKLWCTKVLFNTKLKIILI